VKIVKFTSEGRVWETVLSQGERMTGRVAWWPISRSRWILVRRCHYRDRVSLEILTSNLKPHLFNRRFLWCWKHLQAFVYAGVFGLDPIQCDHTFVRAVL
jgi:hypothetical protein